MQCLRQIRTRFSEPLKPFSTTQTIPKRNSDPSKIFTKMAFFSYSRRSGYNILCFFRSFLTPIKVVCLKALRWNHQILKTAKSSYLKTELSSVLPSPLLHGSDMVTKISEVSISGHSFFHSRGVGNFWFLKISISETSNAFCPSPQTPGNLPWEYTSTVHATLITWSFRCHPH